ncbi:transcriptional regulator, ArsR family [Candidatus Koribacter versatilis Ellin345]|uniref:Transcriptional regulator, ArsR family n=1 Tax=Koribacter versatilis (strain Ellin345) TaxID=204669 RepID=Q1IQA0_KORVE|nr:winged helix-turn-helix domain-containing protein [Candidatus Koribacter versatilis]ABF40950.1 transcriptional regulator, ArsR family [Candidatus Koribacter versatilis Ellin345]
MDARNSDLRAAAVAATIGEPARARMLYSLIDGRARTSTELAVLAEVSPSTASVHLKRLVEHELVKMQAQGKHRYFSLYGTEVAAALEALNVISGPRPQFAPNTPVGLRAARTCYDHIAGALGVALHDQFHRLGWLRGQRDYELTTEGRESLKKFGMDLESVCARRRRFAYACVDWSERRPHLAGALGAAVLELVEKKKWVQREPDGRALEVTRHGRSEFRKAFGLEVA